MTHLLWEAAHRRQVQLRRPALADQSAGAALRALCQDLLRFAAPASAMMLLSSLALLVDTFFIAGLGSEALAGMALVFPLYLILIMSFGGGLGVGMSVALSLRMGRGDRRGAAPLVCAAFALSIALAIAFAGAFWAGGRALFTYMTSSSAVVSAALELGRPLLYGSPILALSLTLTNLLRCTKRVKEACMVLLAGTAVTAALNPLLIYGRAGLPALGMAGAGLATVVGFFTSAVVAMATLAKSGALTSFQHDSCAAVRGSSTSCWPMRRELAELVRLALPVLGLYVATNAVFLSLTSIWVRFGTDAVAAYGLAVRLEYMIALVLYGVGSAIMTLGGEAWGAGRHRDFVRICWICAVAVFAVSAALSVVLWSKPAVWFRLFGVSAGVAAAGAAYLRAGAVGYPFYALTLTLNYAYQTIGRAHVPLVLSAARGFVLAVPIAYCVVQFNGPPSAAAAGVTASLIALGVATAWCLPRSIELALPQGARP